MTRLKKAAVGALSALTIAGSMAIAAPAEARPWHNQHRGWNNGWNNGGALAAGIIGGLALGALASQSYMGPSYGAVCTVQRQRFVDRRGRRVVRDVEVCR